MLKRLRAPSPPLVISLIALFVALGGTTYAATNLPANSVGTTQLKNNAVTAPKIKNGAVTAAKLVAPEAWHEIGAPGQPPFLNGWTNTGLSYVPAAGYYKDPFGVVHLKGDIKSGIITTTAFRLPVGYRPGHELDEVILQSPGSGADLYISPDGYVNVDTGSNSTAFLDGVTFRVGE